MRLAMRVGDRLLQLLQGLNVSEGFEPLSRLPPQMLFLLGKPRSATEAETVRNVFWITYVMERLYTAGTVWSMSMSTYVMERLYTAGTVWSMSMSDEDVSQMMPCRFSDLMSGVFVPTRGRQRLFTNNMLLHHHSLTTDAWTLYIKATILFSKVRTFNGRYRLTPNARSPNTETTPTQTEVFLLLDQTIAAFPQHIPPAFRTPVDTTVDPLLYMAHLLPHVAMIQLHDPHANFSDPNDRSAIRVASAVQSILELIYAVCATSFDLIYLDHACSFCWFVAGAAIIRLLKAKMNFKDEAEVERLTQELNVVKFVLGNLGARTMIGIRQIKLLKELYEDEINSNLDRADYIYTLRRSADAEPQAAIVDDSV
ncbi:hypothetical protein FRC04_006223 [Tulasnella sp. 424]|nr:hypothetical protein FRC04_006223 [Tulasnella sp. 424]